MHFYDTVSTGGCERFTIQGIYNFVIFVEKNKRAA